MKEDDAVSQIRECDLPGIGRKFQIDTRSGDRLVVVVHDDGKRELFHFDNDDPELSISMVALDDTEARQVAAIIGGMTYQPKALESLAVTMDDLVIDWVRVEPAFCCAGQSIGDLAIRQTTGASIIAIIEPDHTKRISPGPDEIIAINATLVVAGERHQVKRLRQLLTQGSV